MPSEDPTDLIDEIRSKYAQGCTLKDLAQDLHRDEEHIRRLMIAAGIPRRPRGTPLGKHLPAGGRITDQDGYILVRVYDHPQANSGGYLREHRLVMEEALGRDLLPAEVVHHRNGKKDDNRLANLQLFASDAELKTHVLKGNQHAAGDVGNPKRSVRIHRSPQEIVEALRALAATLPRPIQRNDLCPPNPSYRAIARVFGTWQQGVRFALDDVYRATSSAELGWLPERAS